MIYGEVLCLSSDIRTSEDNSWWGEASRSEILPLGFIKRKNAVIFVRIPMLCEAFRSK